MRIGLTHPQPNGETATISPALQRLGERGRRRRTIAASAPLAACFIVPLVQLGGVVYLYDLLAVLAILMVRFPSSRSVRQRRFWLPWVLLGIGVCVSYVSSIFRAGFVFRSAAYSAQFLLALAFTGSLVRGLRSGLVDGGAFGRYVSGAVVVSACLGITQYVLLQTQPALADSLYRAYLDIAAFDPLAYEKIYWRSWTTSGLVRIIGTWGVATSYGGMMALGGAWLLLADWSPRFRLLGVCATSLAAVLTQTRHAWVVAAVVALALVRFTRRRGLPLVAPAFAALLVISLLALERLESGGSGISDQTSLDQIASRFDRTTTEGTADSSIQLRYVEGTQRFLEYAVLDPTILLVGFGMQTERGLGDQAGSELQFGYVSNGWLLLLRNCGVLAFAGLLMLHVRLFRYGDLGRWVAVATAVIIASDNYATHAPAAFFAIVSLLCACYGQVGGPAPATPSKTNEFAAYRGQRRQ